MAFIGCDPFRAATVRERCHNHRSLTVAARSAKPRLTPRRRVGYNVIPGYQAPAGVCHRALHERFHALIRGQRTGAWPTLQRLGLWALSLPYGLAVRLRNLTFDRGWRRSEVAPIPVVSV